MRYVITSVVFITLFCVSAPAKSWCDRLLFRKDNSIERLQVIAGSLETQIRHNNRFTPYPIQVEIERLEFLNKQPLGVVLNPELRDKEWLYQPNLTAFVNPNMIELDWSDTKRGLDHQPGFLLLVENVKVRKTTGNELSLTQLLHEEAEIIRSRNPELNFQIMQASASEFRDLKFKMSSDNHFVVWVEGEIENFQAKRILLIMLEHAFEALARDAKYVRKKL
jgi:hypothetical protein